MIERMIAIGEQMQQLELLLEAIRTQQSFVIPVSNSCGWKICPGDQHLTRSLPFQHLLPEKEVQSAMLKSIVECDLIFVV